MLIFTRAIINKKLVTLSGNINLIDTMIQTGVQSIIKRLNLPQADQLDPGNYPHSLCIKLQLSNILFKYCLRNATYKSSDKIATGILYGIDFMLCHVWQAQ